MFKVGDIVVYCGALPSYKENKYAPKYEILEIRKKGSIQEIKAILVNNRLERVGEADFDWHKSSLHKISEFAKETKMLNLMKEVLDER